MRQIKCKHEWRQLNPQHSSDNFYCVKCLLLINHRVAAFDYSARNRLVRCLEIENI